jgi:hypothetical protein
MNAEVMRSWLPPSLATFDAFEPVHGGLNNTSYRLRWQDGVVVDGAVHREALLKLYGAGTAALNDRSRERVVMEHLATLRLSKRLLAVLPDGRGHVEEWLEGTTVPFSQMASTYGEAIGEVMGRLHGSPLPEALRHDGHAPTPFWSDLEGWALELHRSHPHLAGEARRSLPSPTAACPSPPGPCTPTAARAARRGGGVAPERRRRRVASCARSQGRAWAQPARAAGRRAGWRAAPH